MIKINVKYRIQDGNIDYAPGIYEVDEKEAKEMLKLPFVTKVLNKNEKTVKNSTPDVSKNLDNKTIINDEKDAPEVKPEEQKNENDEENDLELSEEEIRALYKEKTGKNAGNKKLETLLDELK